MKYPIHRSLLALLVGGLALVAVPRVQAGPFTGAIFTSLSDGTTVNQNIYAAREDVYLNGGPQHPTGDGLPDGIYFFQVTDPSGQVLLSTDDAINRQLQVINGVVAGAYTVGVPDPHDNGDFNPANGSTPVQLFPFDFTPNPGGEYKAWLIQFKDELGNIITDSQGDPVVTIDASDPKVLHFNNSASKTDNFKVRVAGPPGPGPGPGPTQPTIPEPTSVLLMVLGVGGAGAYHYLSKRRAATN